MVSRHSHARRGAALPVVLLLMVILTISLTASFTLNDAEIRVVDDHKEQLDAFVLAESGRERYLADRAAFGLTGPPAAAESIRVNLDGGYADVVLTRVRTPSALEPTVYVLRSRGVRTISTRYNVPPASRTVAEYVMWQDTTVNTLAAWTSLSGLLKNGGSGTLSGVDGCGVSPTVSGVAVPNTPGYMQSGGSSVPAGNPPINYMGTQEQSNNSVNIDWESIKAGTALTPTVEIPGDMWPSFADPNYWPTIKVNGNYTLPTDGRGLLIVTGSLTVDGSQVWDGVILVGQTLTSNGSNTVNGAVISGLDLKLGIPVPASDLGNGTKTYQYNSCNVKKALGGLGGFISYRNAWADNWPSY